MVARTFRTAAVFLKREIISARFFACASICSLFMIFFVYMDYKTDFRGFGLYYFLQGVEHSGAGNLLLMIVVLPVSTVFCEDWESGMIKFLLPRSGRRNYALSLTVTAGFTSGLCMFLAYTIFSIFILIKFPLVPELDDEKIQYLMYSFPNGTLLTNGHEILCYFLYFLTRSTMAALFGALAVFQSVVITNKRFAVISPVIMESFLSVITRVLKLPSYLDPIILFNNHLALYKDLGGSLDNVTFSPLAAFYPTIYCCLSLTIIALCVSLLVKIKVGNKI